MMPASLLRGCAALMLTLCAWTGEAPAALDLDRVEALTRELTAIPQRGMGEPGAVQALDLIEARLRAANIATARVRHTVTVPADRGSWLTLGADGEHGARIVLTPLPANGAATAGTGGAVLEGPLLDAGRGTLGDFSGKNVAGAIVVLDADSGDGWTNAAMLGALAVVVRDPGTLDRARLAALSVPATLPFPRFAADLPRPLPTVRVRLQSTVVWEPRSAWSLCALIPGAGTAPTHLGVVTAGYEANGGLPNAGATRAWNAALLCETALAQAADPPRRSALFVWNGARGEMFRGIREITAFLATDRDEKRKAGWKGDEDGLAVQLDRLHATQVWRTTLALDALAPMRERGFDGEAVIARIRTLAEERARELPARSDFDSDRSAPEALALKLIGVAVGARADALQAVLDPKRNRYSRRRQLDLPEAESLRLADEIQVEDDEYRQWRSVQLKLDSGRPLDAGESVRVAPYVGAACTVLEQHRDVLQRRLDDLRSLTALRQLVGDRWPSTLLALDLADGNDRCAAHPTGYFTGDFGKDLSWLANALGNAAKGQRGFDATPWTNSEEFESHWPAPQLSELEQLTTPRLMAQLGHQHEVGMVAMFLPGLTVSTTRDLRPRLGTPTDTWEALDRARLRTQSAVVPRLARALAGLSDNDAARKGKIGGGSGSCRLRIITRAVGTRDGTRGLAFAYTRIAYSGNRKESLAPRTDWIGDIQPLETRWGDALGEDRVPWLPYKRPEGNINPPVLPYGIDPGTGLVTRVAASAGRQKGGSDLKLDIGRNGNLKDVLGIVFEARPSTLYRLFDPRLLAELPVMKVLSAGSNGQPQYAHIESADQQVAVWTEPGIRLRLTASHGQVGNRLTLLGTPDPQRAGITIGLEPGLLSGLTEFDAAEDMFQLNEERLAKLRSSGVDSDSQVAMHARAERHQEEASSARAAGDLARARTEAASAWALSSRVYPEVNRASNDVVYGLVILLLFAIPFALICERLLLAGSTIARKVIGFSSCFVAVFLFFFFLHPAFRLATTPMVIFLAFVILLMSAWVIAIVYGRFELEMQHIRRAGMGVHRADVNRLGTLFATVTLGISNMRRRPLRTALTAITVALMTFILLTFASFSPAMGTKRIDLGVPPTHPGIVVRQNAWGTLHEGALDRLQGLAGATCTLHPLRWVQPNKAKARVQIAGNAATVGLAGIVGLLPGDPSRADRALVRGALAPDAPRGLDGDGADWLFLAPEVQAELGVQPGEAIRLHGRSLRVGTVDLAVAAGLTQLDGEALTPLALESASGEDRQRQAAGDAGAGETTATVHVSPQTVAWAHADTLAALGGSLRAVTLVPRDARTDIDLLATGIADQLATSLRVGNGDRTELVTGVNQLNVAGLGAVLIPLILGGLIIFSTMLNSVAERGREIFIYASLGLAPIHVAALFLVEAGIYAVLGGLAGYMLAQLVVSALGWAAAMGWGVQPDLNYSSFAAVATILLVMITVLLSALYPALVASRAANPGTADFRLPDPDGDHVTVTFPFTVAARDVRGLLAYLRGWLAANTEASTGCFTAADAAYTADGDQQRFQVDARIWLAPFDLGISQRFRLLATPTDLKAISAIQVDIELLSGQRSDWTRANVAFMKELRLQFLVWRTLSPEAMDRFRAEGGDPAAAERVARQAAADTTGGATDAAAGAGA